MKKFFLFIWEIIKIVVIALIIVIPIRMFIFQPFSVRGASMEPNFFNLDYLIVEEISYRFTQPQRGDVIIFYTPEDNSTRLIKRVVGLPGEGVKVSAGRVWIDNQLLDESDYLDEDIKTLGAVEFNLGEDQYFVLGDNRSLSHDSRGFGPVGKDNIIGKFIFRIWSTEYFK